MEELIKFLGSISIDSHNYLEQLARYYTLKRDYNKVKKDIALNELKLMQEKQEVIKSEEYNDLKITEKKQIAEEETAERQEIIIELLYEKDNLKAKLEVLQYFLKLCQTVGFIDR